MHTLKLHPVVRIKPFEPVATWPRVIAEFMLVEERDGEREDHPINGHTHDTDWRASDIVGKGKGLFFGALQMQWCAHKDFEGETNVIFVGLRYDELRHITPATVKLMSRTMRRAEKALDAFSELGFADPARVETERLRAVCAALGVTEACWEVGESRPRYSDSLWRFVPTQATAVTRRMSDAFDKLTACESRRAA